MSAKGMWKCLILVAVAGLFGCVTSPIYRPGQEFRTVNAAEYEIAVQKNGRVDVLLRSGQVLLANAQPMVWYADEAKPEALPIMGRYTLREQVNDRLGQGQGIAFTRKECEWAIRVYPDKPFFTCQVAFVNTTKKPIKIRALSPWFLGEENNGALSMGPDRDATVVLQNLSPFPGPPQPSSVAKGAGEGLWYLAAFNPVSRQTLVAGFLTSDTGYGTVTLGKTAKAKDPLFNQFSATCFYDPPVEVPPGGKVQSEVLYIAVSEKTPLAGLERYGHAVAAVNEIPLRKPPLPHGTTVLSKSRGQLSEHAVLTEMAIMENDLLRYGWNNVAIGDGWASAPGVWEPDAEAFPRGFATLVQEIHARGMTASLFINPFVVLPESPLVASHPEWLAPVAQWAAPLLPANARILDVTVPEADAYVRDLFTKISTTWGFDGIEGVNVPYGILAAESYTNTTLTRLDVLRVALSAIRQGMGPGKTIAATGAQPALHVRAEVMGIGNTVAPLWQGNPEYPGCREAVDAAALRYFFSPYLYAPSMGAAYFDTPQLASRWPELEVPALTTEQSIAWLTSMAINGGVMKVGNGFAELSEGQKAILKKLLPTLPWTAHPLDVFDNSPPRVWSAQLRTKVGEWFFAAVFNWSSSEEPAATLYMGELGMGPQNVYTVYDFWNDRFFGLAQGQLNVQAPPGSVRLLGFRLFEKRPTFVASTSHFTQGALDTTALEWDAAKRELRGEAKAIPNTDYGLRILVPQPYSVSEVAVSGVQPAVVTKDELLEVNFHNENATEIRWYVRF